jgi:hypothetical protein
MHAQFWSENVKEKKLRIPECKLEDSIKMGFKGTTYDNADWI